MTKILLGITGGISAYKSAELLRLLLAHDFEVRVVMTQSAQQFISPLTFQALSGHRVVTDIFDAEAMQGMGHIELARWSDFILVAPASADFIARLAQGRANDLLTSICCATQVPVAIAPAMNQQMWLNSATQENVALLKRRKILCFGPGEGDQACGEVGPGRLLEPEVLLNSVLAQFHVPALVGKKIMITAGPTREAIDPIRYLTNHSSGKMGYELAKAASMAGAKVLLIAGPTALSVPAAVKKIAVCSALEMSEAVMSSIASVDIFIAAAAVADYRPETIALEKIKKTEEAMTIRLVRNPDILLQVSQLVARPFTVGFAAETTALLDNAAHKLKAKKLDMIIANQVGNEQGFGAGETSITVLTAAGEVAASDHQSKELTAPWLLKEIAKHFVYTQPA